MKPNLVTAKKGLKWYLDLINLDFSKLSDKELFGLWTDIRERLYGEQGERFISNEELILMEERRKQGQEIQNSLRKVLEWSLNPQKFRPPSHKPTRRVVRTKDDHYKPASDPIVFSRPQTKLERVDDRVFLFFLDVEEGLLFDFKSLLNYFPINFIERCEREDCRGYFLKATKKEKRFCSKRCAVIAGSRERWKLNPEEERRKRREYYHGKKGIEQESTMPSAEQKIRRKMILDR